MKPRISMITLGTRNLAEAARFYEEGLGLPRLPSDADSAFFDLRGTWLALYPWDMLARDVGTPPDGQGFRGTTLAHNAASHDHVDQVLTQAVRAGAGGAAQKR